MKLCDSVLEKIWANLFFCFFTIQILSPMINGKTIYLDVVIALLNPCFWVWLFGKFEFRLNYFFSLLAFAVFCICGHAEAAIKFFLIAIEVCCLLYLDLKNMWYIKIYFVISCAFLILQQIFLVYSPEVSVLLGPTNIASLVWGDYASATFTNFYDVFEFGLPRTSGLSREAGFFASLMAMIFLNDYCAKKYDGKKMNFKHKILYIISYIGSFSKVSLVLPLQVLLLHVARYVRCIPFGMIVVMYFALFVYIGNSNTKFLLEPENVTFLHRFGGYVSILGVDIQSFLFGIDITRIQDMYSMPVADFKNFAGFSGFVLQNGFIATFVFFVALYMLGINSLGVLMLLLTTLTTSFETMQNFIVLQYFMLFRYKIFQQNIKWL